MLSWYAVRRELPNPKGLALRHRLPSALRFQLVHHHLVHPLPQLWRATTQCLTGHPGILKQGRLDLHLSWLKIIDVVVVLPPSTTVQLHEEGNGTPLFQRHRYPHDVGLNWKNGEEHKASDGSPSWIHVKSAEPSLSKRTRYHPSFDCKTYHPFYHTTS